MTVGCGGYLWRSGVCCLSPSQGGSFFKWCGYKRHACLFVFYVYLVSCSQAQRGEKDSRSFSFLWYMETFQPQHFGFTPGAVQVGKIDNLSPSCHGGPPEDIVINTLCLGEAESSNFLTVFMLNSYTKLHKNSDNWWCSTLDCSFVFWTNRNDPITFKGPVCKLLKGVCLTLCFVPTGLSRRPYKRVQEGS